MDIIDKRIKFSSLFQGDKTLWILSILLCTISILVIYSSTASMAYRKLDGDTTYYLSHQFVMVLIGIFTAIIFQFIDYKIYYRLAKITFYISLAIMSLTFTLGLELNDAKRWLGVGSLTFQPADIIKITLVIILAKELSIRQNMIDKVPMLPIYMWHTNIKKAQNIFYKVSIPLLFPIFITVLMIMMSSLSTAIVIGGTSLVVLTIGRVRIKDMISLLFVTIGVFFTITMILYILNVGRVNTWKSRITTFFQDDSHFKTQDINNLSVEQFQKHQARVAIASGWLGGVGPGNSTQRSSLPHPYSDYAYAFIVEEYGLPGAVFVLILYLAIFYRALIIFRKCRTAFPAFLVLGLSLIITMQAMLHMIVSVDAGPVTGQTLPLISWGGSSLVFTCISIGIIQNVARRVQKEQKDNALGAERRLILEQWSQVEINNDIKSEYDETTTVLLTEEQNTIPSTQSIDSMLQKDRLSKALDNDKYQSVVIWDNKKKQNDEDNI